MAKTADTAGTVTTKVPGRKRLLRRLEKAYYTHRKAEARASKLRVQVERAEARLAETAQDLVSAQALMDQLNAGQGASADPKAVHHKGTGKRSSARAEHTSTVAKAKKAAPREAVPAKAKKARPSAAPSEATPESESVMANGAGGAAVTAEGTT